MATEHKDMFWIVWCEGGGSPTVKHWSSQRARDEAKRLATENPGQNFIVFQSVAGFQTPERVVETAYDDLPF